MMETVNTLMALLLSLLSGWAVMSRRVRDGVLVKIALISLALGFLSLFFLALDPGGVEPRAFAHALIYLGLLGLAAGHWLRCRACSRKWQAMHRRKADWLTDRDPQNPKGNP